MSPTKIELSREYIKCARSLPYFINNYCQIENKQTGEWVPFHMWPRQMEAAKLMQLSKFVAALKARQVGFSWLGVARCLHKNIFVPNSLVGYWSRRDDESIELLRRHREMHARLPNFLSGTRLRGNRSGNNTHTYRMDNGSEAKAFPTTAGDSYTVAVAMIDEADLIENLNQLLRSVKPTIDAGGQLMLISRPNKDKPESPFKRIYREATEGKNSYRTVFASWYDRPDRTQAWYEEEKRNSLSSSGSLDDLYEQYPTNETEALAARILNKRFPPDWLDQCFSDEIPVALTACDTPGLRVYIQPEKGMRFALGVDPAEGLKGSDDSAIVILRDDGRHAAELNGRIEISIFSSYIESIAKYFNDAKVLVERNNHGHAVLTRLQETNTRILYGKDGRNGWLTDARGKTEMCANAAEKFKNGSVTISSRQTLNQLSSIERSTLSAPEGLNDDLATAYELACIALDSIDMDTGTVAIF